MSRARASSRSAGHRNPRDVVGRWLLAGNDGRTHGQPADGLLLGWGFDLRGLARPRHLSRRGPFRSVGGPDRRLGQMYIVLPCPAPTQLYCFLAFFFFETLLLGLFGTTRGCRLTVDARTV